MTVSISNMAQVWMSNTNTYNGIAMSISTMGYGANNNSRLLSLRVDGNTKFALDGNGTIIVSNNSFVMLPNANTVGAGARAFVYDATTTTFASAVIGGGSNRVPVYSNGRNWLIG
jgi:hypothetical protein